MLEKKIETIIKNHMNRAMAEVWTLLKGTSFGEMAGLYAAKRAKGPLQKFRKGMPTGLSLILHQVGNKTFRVSDLKIPFSRTYTYILLSRGAKDGHLKRLSVGVYKAARRVKKARTPKTNGVVVPLRAAA